MKILFTSPIIEHPAAGGPELRIEASIKALSMVSDLWVVSRAPRHILGGKKAVRFYQNISNAFVFAPSVHGLSLNRYFRKLQKILRNVFLSEIDRDAKFIVETAKKNEIEVIWFGFGNISYSLIKKVKKLQPNLRVVCDTDSVWSRFILRELPFESDKTRINQITADGRAKEIEESEWVNLCDVTTAVSEVDADYYRGLAKDESKIKLFSNVIDFENYSKIPSKPPGFKNPSIYLAGSFGPKSAMDKGARWFIKEVYPAIQAEIPDVHFYIIGSRSKEVLSDIDDNSISILGKVVSVLPYLFHVNISLVPLQFESGTRFKIMEAAACRIPIVSTTLGAEGIPVEHERDILIADNPLDFARETVKLLKNKELAKKLANGCVDLIQKTNSIDSLASEASLIIEELHCD